MSAAKRLREAREGAGYPTAAAAAREFGWNEATYRHHENGTRGFDSEQAFSYGKYYGVSPAWLLGFGKESAQNSAERLRALHETFDLPLGEGRDLEDQLIKQVDSVLVRIIDPYKMVEDGAMGLYFAQNEYVAFSKRVIENVAKTGFREIVALISDSTEMSPTIGVGDMLLVDTAQRKPLHHDQIWLMSKAGRLLIRRLRYIEGKIASAWSDNIGNPPVEIDTSHEQFVIYGRVVWIGQSV